MSLDTTLTALNAAGFGDAVGPIYKAMDEDWELRRIVIDVEGLKCNTVLDALAAVHREIDKHLFTGAGLWLMTMDGWLMLKILFELSTRNIPAFPIHDSIRVRQEDAGEVKRIMVKHYVRMFGATPRIR